MNVLTNDTWNGGSVSSSFFTVSQIASDHPSIVVTQVGWITVYSGVPAGTYTLTYQVCQNSNPANCATATVTVNICSLAAPTILEPSCTQPGSLTVTGLPATGTWTLFQQYNNGTPTSFTGSGSSHTVTGLAAGEYRYRVSIDGCTSPYSTPEYLGWFNNGFTYEMTGIYVDANTDGIVNLGDKVNYTFHLTNTLECDITNVHISDGQITSNALPIAVLPAGQTVTFPGTYMITQDDINAGSVFQWAGILGNVGGGTTYTKAFTEVPLGIPTGFKFIAFVDDNANGIRDAGEEHFSNGHFTWQRNNGITVYAQSGANDYILYETNSANLYDVQFNVNGTCATQFIVTPGSYDDIFVAGADFTTYYFAVTANSCADAGVYLWSTSPPRPNLSYTQEVVLVNYGTDPITSGTVTFNADPLVTVTSVSEPGATMTTNGFTYSFTDLQPLEYRYIEVTMDIPNVPVVNLGDLLTSTVSVTPPTGDTNSANNEDVVNASVTNSYDPNDISENHGPKIVLPGYDLNEELIYTVRFENTGTADALDVETLNYLSWDIDLESVRIIRSSHDFTMEAWDNIFVMRFDDINLPPSVEGTDIGHGSYTFAAKMKPNVQVGDVLMADTEIFFDSNPGIFTNLWTTELVSSLGTNQQSASAFQIWPNPASNVIHALSQTPIQSVRVTDVLGKTIMTRDYASQDISIDISNLSLGVYLLTLQSETETQTVRIVKQ